MAEKDIAEKILADYNDVFADIMNGFLFHGKQIVSPNDLIRSNTNSQYKTGNGEVHEQERDVAKYLKKNGLTVVMTGFEHQTKAEKFMPLRQIGYDGAGYREQILDKKRKRAYPVITLVLYFGLKPWKYSRHLTEVLDIPDVYRPFVSDYEMKNLCQVAFLTPEQVKCFRSDFRYVADYFVQKRLTGKYRASVDTINHVDATLKLMSIITGSTKFRNAATEFSSRKEGVSMRDVLDSVENKGKKKGMIQGYNKAQRENVVRMLDLGKFSREDIAAALGITVDAVEKIEQQEMNLT